MVEAVVQFVFGVRFAFPAMLLLVILALIGARMASLAVERCRAYEAARRDALIGAAVLAIALAMPLFLSGRYVIGQLTLFFIWATIVTQWNLVFGVAGIFRLPSSRFLPSAATRRRCWACI